MSTPLDRSASRSPPPKRARLEENANNSIQEDPTPVFKGKPGDVNHPDTFLDCYMADKRAAAYVGFQSTSELHTAAVSWPFLRAAVAMQPIVHKLPKEKVLYLLRDARFVGGLAVIDDKWSLLDCDGKGTSNDWKAEHLAIILINLRSDLLRMAAAPDPQNKQLHQQHSRNFEETYPSHACPRIKYPVRPPLLHPLPEESRLEPYNRVLVILRHIRNIMNSGTFNVRYKGDGFKHGGPIAEDCKPVWMQSRVPGKSNGATTQQSEPLNRASAVFTSHNASPSVTSQAILHYSISPVLSVSIEPRQAVEVDQSSAFFGKNLSSTDQPPLSLQEGTESLVACPFTIIWDHSIEPEHTKPGLKRALDRAKGRGIRLPSELQRLRTDPRLFKEESLLYDHIRDQFECESLRIELNKLFLQFSTSAFGDDITITQNLDSELWSDTQEALRSPMNRNFVLRVGFFAIDE